MFYILLFQEHTNYYGEDEDLGPVVLSYKTEVISSQDNIRLILRQSSGSSDAIISSSDIDSLPKLVKVSFLNLNL